MKNLLIVAALVALPGTALADGARWAGAYVGADVGGARASTSGVDGDGMVGGVFAGYGWQVGGVVAGVEIGARASSVDGSVTASGFGLAVTETDRFNYLATAHARLGFALGPALVYGLGGVAGTKLDRDGVITGAVSANYHNSQIKYGWMAGAGVEWAISDRWSARAEYAHLQFSGDTVNYQNLGVVVTYDRLDVDMVKAGISYRF